MPKGPLSPSAKTWFSEGASAPSAARSTRIRPSRVSDMKMSPLGATMMSLGPESPERKTLTVKPAGTDRDAPAGLSTTLGPLPAESVAKGGGSFAMSTECTAPGASWRQSPASPASATGTNPVVATPRSVRVERKAIRLARLPASGTGIGIVVPGTAAEGAVRKWSRVAASQVSPEARRAAE